MPLIVIVVMLCLTTFPVINPDNVQPSSWFAPATTIVQKGK